MLGTRIATPRCELRAIARVGIVDPEEPPLSSSSPSAEHEAWLSSQPSPTSAFQPTEPLHDKGISAGGLVLHSHSVNDFRRRTPVSEHVQELMERGRPGFVARLNELDSDAPFLFGQHPPEQASAGVRRFGSGKNGESGSGGTSPVQSQQTPTQADGSNSGAQAWGRRSSIDTPVHQLKSDISLNHDDAEHARIRQQQAAAAAAAAAQIRQATSKSGGGGGVHIAAGVRTTVGCTSRCVSRPCALLLFFCSQRPSCSCARSLLLVVFRFCRRWHPEAGLVSRDLEQRPAWLAKPIARHESNAGLSQINERQSLKSQRVTGLRKAGFDKPTWMITQADGACSPKHRHEQARVSACA